MWGTVAGDRIVSCVLYPWRVGPSWNCGQSPAVGVVVGLQADVGKDLATMAPEQSPWQAAARPEGVTSGTFYARFRRYLQAAGLPLTGVRVLRHTAAKLRRDAGESIEDVSAFLDHSSLAVTTVYLRRLEGETDRTWRDVAQAIGVGQ
jgi:hypothetical protein